MSWYALRYFSVFVSHISSISKTCLLVAALVQEHSAI
jgi:hypothetical protein